MDHTRYQYQKLPNFFESSIITSIIKLSTLVISLLGFVFGNNCMLIVKVDFEIPILIIPCYITNVS